MLLHYLGKLEIQILCIYSANVEENANCENLLRFNKVTKSLMEENANCENRLRFNKVTESLKVGTF